ncbi:MAG: hypothetical protein B6U73_02715 [Desulfurococcales archaeon ex4484_204]|nr:MAG: hypothetical protein B6U73_02715 [Desulfurococcales archaeon ex4484_204]
MESAVVLAGGAGKGLKTLTGGRPKALFKIAGKSVIEYVLNSLIDVGIKKVTLVTDKPSEFEDVTIKYGRKLSFDLREQEGTEVIGALLTARDELSRGSLMVYSDTLVPKEAYEMVINTYGYSHAPVIMVVPEEDTTLYGAVSISINGCVEGFIEKPVKHIEGAYAFGGLAVFNEQIVRLMERLGRLDEAISEYCRTSPIKAAVWSGWWVDVGYPWNVLEALYYTLSEYRESVISRNAKVSPSAVIEGPVVIEDGAVVDHYAVVRGPVYVGKDSLIGTHAFVRPYTSVEDNAFIGSYSEVVWSLVGARATVGRGSFLGYSVVGEDAIVEPSVITKLLVKPEAEGIKAIREVKRRRKYYKIGAFIGRGARVTTCRVIEPGTEIVK